MLQLLKQNKAEEFIKICSKELKKIQEIKMPNWALFVKTGHGKERPPMGKNWWYIRTASILRKIQMKSPIGVSHLRKIYSTKKNKGHKPEKSTKAGGKITRTILQQLEKAGLVEQNKGPKKGRKLTEKGIKFINKISKEAK